jgi:hypothetical protein
MAGDDTFQIGKSLVVQLRVDLGPGDTNFIDRRIDRCRFG